VSRNWHCWSVPSFAWLGWSEKKNPLATAGKRVEVPKAGSGQPQDPLPHEPELQLPPPPIGLAAVMENPDRYPASMKSTLTAPHFSKRSSSMRNCSPSSLYTLSLSFGSSRAKPRDGPLQPPCIRAMRTAELILFCSRYVFKLLTAVAVTSNMCTSSR
jgi:hypothetical protein